MGSIDTACRRSPVGKLTRSALYFHISALDLVPEEIESIVLRAGQMYASWNDRLVGCDVVKVRRDGSAVSFLWYPWFNSNGHPRLRHSACVSFSAECNVRCRSWKPNGNPPILHRKETLVPSYYEFYELFQRLTYSEEQVGLLENAPGFLRQWEELLRNRGFWVSGHALSIYI